MSGVEIIRDLRLGEFDVLVGINLLREGLDMPEVSLVAILDADKQGFLRSARSLIQTVGRAARNLEGRAILYGDTITAAMQATIDETDRRRIKQQAHNELHGITPKGINKAVRDIIDGVAGRQMPDKKSGKKDKHGKPIEVITSPEQLAKRVVELEADMYKHAENLEFEEAARSRDKIEELRAAYYSRAESD